MKTRLQPWPCRVLATTMLLLFGLLWNSEPARGQQAPGATPVPNLVQFGGRLLDRGGKPMSGVVGVTFLL